jgi:hypothetical protein
MAARPAVSNCDIRGYLATRMRGPLLLARNGMAASRGGMTLGCACMAAALPSRYRLHVATA